jgi:hypothetical protein
MQPAIPSAPPIVFGRGFLCSGTAFREKRVKTRGWRGDLTPNREIKLMIALIFIRNYKSITVMKPFVLLPLDTDRNEFTFLKKDSGPVSIATYVPIDEAREALFKPFTSEWNTLHNYLASNTNTKPRSLNDEQYFAFEMNPAQFDGVLSLTSPARIGCILCINPGKTTEANDDVISVLLLGLKRDDTRTGAAVIEKWPGLYTGLDMNKRLEKIIDNILTPATGPVPGNFYVARGFASGFRQIWGAIRGYINNGGTSQRDTLRTSNQPLVFTIEIKECRALLQSNPAKIAGVFGFDDTMGSPGYIRPFFVGVDANNRPVTDVVFPVPSVDYVLSNEADVVVKMFT